MIEVKSLEVKINDKYLLQDCSFSSVRQKGVIAVIGPNGAGKSTLAKSICGLNPFDGEITLFERSLIDISRNELAKLVTYSSEINSQVDLTVDEVLSYARINCQDDHELKKEIIKSFDLIDIVGQEVFSLSGGERQRLANACAFYQDTKIVVLDEPTNFLDPKHIDDLKTYLSMTDNKLVILVSHDINFCLSVCDEVLALKKGEIFFYKDKREVLQEKLLNQVFDKEFTYYLEEGFVR